MFIPAGVYRITRSLTVGSGTTLAGAGYCSTIIVSKKPIGAIIHLKQVAGPMAQVRDLWVAGPSGGNQQTDGIWVDVCNGVTIRDCWASAGDVDPLIPHIKSRELTRRFGVISDNIIDVPRHASADRLHEPVQLRRLTFAHNPHPAIGQILHKASHGVRSRDLHRRITKPHALNAAGEMERVALHGRGSRQ